MGSHVETAPAATAAATPSRRAWLMLGLATVGFAINFWAWALLSPLGPKLKESLHLSAFQQALLVAVPVVVGSLGRIPVGALTDRFGGRVMFPVVSFVTIVPVLFLGLSGHSSLAALLAGGFFLGIAGTAFAVGVPFVSAWFPPGRRGFAIGVFGAGMGGTAISALTTVKLVKAHGMSSPFVITAVALPRTASSPPLVLRDAPSRALPTEPVVRRLGPPSGCGSPGRRPRCTRSASAGTSRSACTCPPTSRARTAWPGRRREQDGRLRAVGGRHATDRRLAVRPIGPIPVLASAFGVVAAAALVQSAAPALAPTGTIAFLVMAAALGAASGGVFALVAQRAPANKVGAVTGVVGAAGGLGGFVPPLVMGALYGRVGNYAAGLIALASGGLAGRDRHSRSAAQSAAL